MITSVTSMVQRTEIPPIMNSINRMKKTGLDSQSKRTKSKGSEANNTSQKKEISEAEKIPRSAQVEINKFKKNITKSEPQSKININTGLKDELAYWLDTSDAKRQGYISQAQFATEAIRFYLHKVKTQAKGVHLILPNLQDKRLNLDIDIKGDEVVCNICNGATSCIHVKTVYEDKKVIETLKDANIELPPKNI